MASGFLTLEDGRCFARRMYFVTNILDVINQEVKNLPSSEEFSQFLSIYIPGPDDEANGYGGFYNNRIKENIMVDLDLREIAPMYRALFWNATQRALSAQIKKGLNDETGDLFLLKYLLDMHKCVNRREPQHELSDIGENINEYSGKRIGPGWENEST